MTKGFFQKLFLKVFFFFFLSNENLPNFDMKNMIFNVFNNIFNDFSWKKNGPNLPDFKGKKNSKLPDFCDKFQ